MSAQVAADLRAAADVLERDGWTQGDYEKPDGCKCAMGAIYTAVVNAMRPESASLGVTVIPHKIAFREAIGVFPVAYNDAPGRTADEVIAALRAAADRAEAEQ